MAAAPRASKSVTLSVGTPPFAYGIAHRRGYGQELISDNHSSTGVVANEVDYTNYFLFPNMIKLSGQIRWEKSFLNRVVCHKSG
jgi:hypothetical protein